MNRPDKRKRPKMENRSFEGKTLTYAARALGFRHRGYRIFLLRDEGDQVGQRIAEDYDLNRILRDHPELVTD